jgi:hypothetical protein
MPPWLAEVERLTRDRNVKNVHVAVSPEIVEEVLRKDFEDFGFALTDAEAAEAERAVAADRSASYVPKPRRCRRANSREEAHAEERPVDGARRTK